MLSNVVNYRMDERFAELARCFHARYSRYADDLTFSSEEDAGRIGQLRFAVRRIAADCGYRIHYRRKLSVRRQHQRQVVTGLVVNERVQLPRPVRRRLRAIGHHFRQNRPTTLTPDQYNGWMSLLDMIDNTPQ